MKKVIFTLMAVVGCVFASNAQKFALIDMEYVLQNIPSYEIANEQINQLSQQYQAEVEAIAKQASDLYKEYQTNMVFLSGEQKKKKEQEITAKEKEAAELRNLYFGPEGNLYKFRQNIMSPIQENVYNAVKAVSEERGYQCIFDRASSVDIIFASPKIDISDEVLVKLGYSK